MTRHGRINIDAGTLGKQAIASDPANTVWVSANAGSGKTHVLSQRVVRLLLDGVAPSRILCLTYTKTAAAEMENRVFQRLSAWTALDDEALEKAIRETGAEVRDHEQLKRARTLFANALESPGGLQIQTIHAFCTTILQRFPLEANIAGHFELLDDETGQLLREEAIRRVITGAAQGSDPALSDAFDLAYAASGESTVKELLGLAFAGPSRAALSDFLDDRAAGTVGDQAVYRAAGLEPGTSEASIAAAVWPLKAMPPDMIDALSQSVTAKTLKTLKDFASSLAEAKAESKPESRFAKLKSAFLKKDGDPKKVGNFAKEPFVSAVPGFEPAFESACEEIRAALDANSRLQMVEASLAAHRLLDAARVRYRQLKRARGMLDYDDLTEAARTLLTRSSGAAWVQYKLDQGIEHVLVDEAQDTSPRQWDIVNALTGDFFAGETASGKLRTLFVVGDEKQSIYSFQGARPEVFAETGRQKKTIAMAARRKFEEVTLPLSFRSVPEVLGAVDLVFEPLRAAGLFSGDDAIVHEALRRQEHGRVEVWPRILKDRTDARQSDVEDDWTLAVDHLPAPAVLLARDIARTIAAMITSEVNPARGERVQAGDILVLVRKRDSFVQALTRELKDRHVPVAGADRLVLTDHIAVLDLMALARTVLQPDDDLSLAALLKSPVFNFTDDDLIMLAAGRKPGVSLMARLRAAGGTGDKYRLAVEQLDRWRSEADFAPVHEFFARIMGRDRVRARLIGRFGSEAADVLDEFMSYALTAEKAGIHGLQVFVETLAAAAPELKRELGGGRGEVRIMTVHGAKGLEAKYVFLVDSGGAPAITRYVPRLFSLPGAGNGNAADIFFWAPSAVSKNAIWDRARDAAKKQAEAEYRRQLYVGMTRAEDVLIVCGYGGQKEPEGTWLGHVHQALESSQHKLVADHPVTGRSGLVYRLGETVFQKQDPAQPATVSPAAPPAFLRKAAPPAIRLPRPLTPSGQGLAVDDAPFAPVRSPVLDAGDEPSLAMRRGAAIHRLLEVLPDYPPHERSKAASAYAKRQFPEGASGDETIAGPVLAILENPAFSALFLPGSRAEVSISGEISIGGQARTISGKIDRLAVHGNTVLIADYKTSRPAPRKVADVPSSHIAQLALYGEVLRKIYPGHQIAAALVYTEGPFMIEIGQDAMSEALEALTGS